MKPCPQCHLLLETAEWNGRDLLVCGSCSGIWIRPEALASALAQDADAFCTFLVGLPSVANAEAFVGLMRLCPICRTVRLADGPVPAAPEACAAICPQCGGVWLDSTARHALLSRAVPPVTLARTIEAISQSLPDDAVMARAPSPVQAEAPQPPPAAEESALRFEPQAEVPFEVPESRDVLEANAEFARSSSVAGMAAEPVRHAVVLTCMDSRIPVLEMLGLKLGEAHVLRNAGGLATSDALRSLLISHHLLGTLEFYIIGHTDCGMTHFSDAELLDHLARETGVVDATPDRFLAFGDAAESIRDQVMRVRMHPWLEGRVSVRGFLYDVDTGLLTEVT